MEASEESTFIGALEQSQSLPLKGQLVFDS